MTDFVIALCLVGAGVIVAILANLDIITRDKSQPFDWRDWI